MMSSDIRTIYISILRQYQAAKRVDVESTDPLHYLQVIHLWDSGILRKQLNVYIDEHNIAAYLYYVNTGPWASALELYT